MSICCPRNPSKGHPHAEMKYKKILISCVIAVRVKRKINPGRTHRQLVLEAESDRGTKSFEILAECIRHDVGPAVIRGLTTLGASLVWRDIAVVKKKRSGQISNQALAQFDIDDIVCQPADRVAVLTAANMPAPIS